MHHEAVDALGQRNAAQSSAVNRFRNCAVDVAVALFRHDDFGVFAVVERNPVPGRLQRRANLRYACVMFDASLRDRVFSMSLMAIQRGE